MLPANPGSIVSLPWYHNEHLVPELERILWNIPKILKNPEKIRLTTQFLLPPHPNATLCEERSESHPSMVKRAKSPEVIEEARYFTVCQPFPLNANWAAFEEDQQDCASWIAECIGLEYLYAIHYKPSVRFHLFFISFPFFFFFWRLQQLFIIISALFFFFLSFY